MFQGLKGKEGELTNDAGISILKFNSSGEVFILDKEDQEIKISPADQEITIDSGSGHKIVIEKQTGLIKMGEEGDTFTVSEAALRSYIQSAIFAVFNTHVHVSNGPGVPTNPTITLMPRGGVPGLIALSPAVDGTLTSEFAARNTKVTEKTS